MSVPRKFQIPKFGITIILDGEGGGSLESGLETDFDDSVEFCAAMHTLQSFILALACEGVWIGSGKIERAIQTTLDAIANHYGD